MSLDIRKRLDKEILICDGAMGTYLNQKGVSYERCFDELNLSSPEIVLQVHREYIDAGAEMIETNTFGANRYRLAAHGLENRMREINIKGAKIAREAREISGVNVIIAGSIGPLGKQFDPIGKIKLNEASSAFREQAEALLEGGIDLFIIETVSSLDEMEIAIEAIREFTNIPIIAQMTFTQEGITLFGSSPLDIAQKLTKLDVDVIGTNCSVGPQMLIDVVEQLSAGGIEYISAMPNAGMPKYFDGRFIYMTSPDYFADCARQFVAAGARILGGCCGTTPEHIAAIVRAIKGIRPQQKTSRIISPQRPEFEKRETGEAAVSRFYAKLKSEFVVSVEIDPPKGTNPAKMIDAAVKLKEAGSDAVNIADSPMARVRMSCLALSYLIGSAADIDIVLHFTARDRNLMGLQSDLIGAHALGLRNILALTGDPPSTGDYPQATAVYDVDSVGLIKIIAKLNQGTDFVGNSIGKPTNFSIGVAANPGNVDLEKEVSRIREKLTAGGQYLMTQPMYELGPVLEFLDLLQPDAPILIGVLPLVNFKHAQFLHNEVPGISIPEIIRSKMEKAGGDSARVGEELALKFIDEVKKYVNGIYLMPSFGRFETCINLVREIKKGR